MHGGLFSDKELERDIKLCQITFNNEDEHARALWEWLYFGLYVIVDGIRDNNRTSEPIGTAIAREVFSEFFFHLKEAGLGATELAAKENDITQRFDRYNTVLATGKLECVGLAAAALILGVDLSPANIPREIEAYQLGICANQTYIAGLKLVNDFFGEHVIVA
jgi:hypothetical protein